MMPDLVDINHYRPRTIVDNAICNVHITYTSKYSSTFFKKKLKVFLNGCKECVLH